jgi:multidrug resistance efflux pump
MSTLYGVAGLMAMSYLGSLAYQHVFWLEAQTSVISAPAEALVSYGDGIVTWTNFKPGDAVKAGDVVARISDNSLEQNIEQAAITVRVRESRHAYLVRRLDIEKKRQETLFGASSLKAAQSSVELDALNARLQAALRDLRQLPATAVGPLAQARDRVARLKQSIALKSMTRQGTARTSADAVLSSEGANQSVSPDIEALAAQVDLAQSEIGIATRRHESYLKQRDRLSLRAPFDGILRRLPHADSSTVRRGDVAAVVERVGERGVTAYVRQDQLTHIRLGAEAVVHVPATRQTFKATVTEIDPMHHARREHGQLGGVAPAVPTAKSDMAAVRLELTGSNQASDANVYRDGLPAVTTIGLGGKPKTVLRPAATKAASGGSIGGG